MRVCKKVTCATDKVVLCQTVNNNHTKDALEEHTVVPVTIS